jgi:hypothetical protein
MKDKLYTWIPCDAAQAFKTSGSTATMATRKELKLSPAPKSRIRKHMAMIDSYN